MEVNMYAIIANGSKQYKAEVGATIKFEKLNGKVGDKVEFDVLLLSDNGKIKVGKDAAKVKAFGEITEQGKDKKIVVFKYKAKKNERKKQGHRQPFTAVKITAIGAPEAPAETAATEEVKAPAKKPAAKKTTTATKTATKTTAPKTAKKTVKDAE